MSAYATPAPACSPSSWPRFHHDDANSGLYGFDAVAPGRPLDGAVRSGVLSFTAPGDDLMCGRAARYQLVTSARPITPESFARAQPLGVSVAPEPAGRRVSVVLPASTLKFVAIRAIDMAGNVGLPLALERG